jgi:hypothetical protein
MTDINLKYRKLKVELVYVVDQNGWMIGCYEDNGDSTVTFYMEEYGEPYLTNLKDDGGKVASWKKLKDMIKKVEPSAVFDDSNFSARISK